MSLKSDQLEILLGVYRFNFLCILCLSNIYNRRDVPVGVPLDLSTPTGMSCIVTYGENCKSDNVSKYRVLLVAFQLLSYEKLMSRKKTVNS